MDQIRRIFKKSGVTKVETRSERNRRVRRSQSMPMRNSGDTDESYFPRDVYKGQRPLKPSDIVRVIQFPPRDVKDTDSFDTEGPYRHREDPDGKDMLSLPDPPKYVSAPTRPAIRPPPMDWLEDLPSEKDLLPPNVFDPAERARQEQYLRRRQQLIAVKDNSKLHRQASLQHKDTSSSYTKASPVHGYHGSVPQPPPYTRTKAKSITHHSNVSAQSLGGEARFGSSPFVNRSVRNNKALPNEPFKFPALPATNSQSRLRTPSKSSVSGTNISTATTRPLFSDTTHPRARAASNAHHGSPARMPYNEGTLARSRADSKIKVNPLNLRPGGSTRSKHSNWPTTEMVMEAKGREEANRNVRLAVPDRYRDVAEANVLKFPQVTKGNHCVQPQAAVIEYV